MLQISPSSAAAIRSELLSGETFVCAGQPQSSVIFHKEDLYLIPFSFLWGGFAIFWEGSAAGLWGVRDNHHQWTFGIFWGIPFVLIGQYVIWGRFFYAAWLKGRTHYAVTNRRVIVVQESWKRQMAFAYIDSLPALIKEAGSRGIGTLRFGPPYLTSPSHRSSTSWNSLAIGGAPVFVDIEDVDLVYRLVCDLRDKARKDKTTL